MKHIWTIVDAKPSKKVKQIKENASPVAESIINRVPINAQMWKMKKNEKDAQYLQMCVLGMKEKVPAS